MPVSEKVLAKPSLPAWASPTPQPVVPSALFARGINGPIQGTFEGLLACQITVSGTHWDPIVPFVGSPIAGLPDIRVRHGDAVVYLPADTASGTAIFPGMKITQDSRLDMNVTDADALQNDPIADVSLDASRGFPLEAKSGSLTMVCRGVPRSALSTDIKAREAVLERALVAMEKAASTLDLARPDINPSRKGVETAKKAVLELATYVGFDEPNVLSAITRITAVDIGEGSRYVAAVDAELAKHSMSEFQSLPSGRVRCHPTKPSVVEVEVGARPLQHDWREKDLGPLQFRFIFKGGVERAPLFDDLFVDGKKIEALDAMIPANGKVDVEMRYGLGNDPPHAIVVREGAKYAYLCRYKAP